MCIRDRGEPWHAADGSHGVWRSYHPMEQVRVSWHASEDAPRSIVDLHLEPAGDQTSVTVRHEPVEDSAAMSARWRAALERIDSLAGDGAPSFRERCAAPHRPDLRGQVRGRAASAASACLLYTSRCV